MEDILQHAMAHWDLEGSEWELDWGGGDFKERVVRIHSEGVLSDRMSIELKRERRDAEVEVILERGDKERVVRIRSEASVGEVQAAVQAAFGLRESEEWAIQREIGGPCALLERIGITARQPTP
jgi:hypothetical protein